MHYMCTITVTTYPTLKCIVNSNLVTRRPGLYLSNLKSATELAFNIRALPSSLMAGNGPSHSKPWGIDP